MKGDLYTIGEIGKICKVPLSTLRYDDRIGVIKPAFVDHKTGYRYYDREALMRIPVLRFYQEARVQWKDISNMLD